MHFGSILGAAGLAAGLFGLGGIAHAEPALRKRPPSYVEVKNAQVMRSFLVFNNAPHDAPERQDGLGLLRERDALLIPSGHGPTGNGSYGAAMLGAAVVMAAHAPEPVRRVFDARVHLGPAVFEGGGMGAGVGGRF